MKKFFTFILIFSAIGIHTSYAQEAKQEKTPDVLYVSEKVPGGNCVCVKKNDNPDSKDPYIHDTSVNACREAKTRIYKCEVTSLPTLIKKSVYWIIQISLLLGVLAIAGLGIAWSIAGSDDPEYKKFLKDWLVNLIIGLIILFLFQYILGIFGWIYTSNI